MLYFVALLIFILVYVVTKFFLGKVDSVAGIAEILAIVAGVAAALIYVGAI